MNVIEKTITLADGRVITLETGKLAKQADGAVMVKMGNTMLLATVVSAQEAGPDVDFMPLSVDYKDVLPFHFSFYGHPHYQELCLLITQEDQRPLNEVFQHHPVYL
mgnify:CR=1 FL=1